MGWTSCYRWYTPTVLRKEYEEDMARSGRIKTFGWCGSFLKCLDTQTDRPFVVDVMVRFFGKNEGYGYKDIESTSGPYDTNIAAARWLRRELAKRNLDPVAYENDWLLYCERQARRLRDLKQLKAGQVVAARRSFELTTGKKVTAGTPLVVEWVERSRVVCYLQGESWVRMRLSSDIILPKCYHDFPLMVV